MNLYQFMGDSPFLAFFLAWLLLSTLTTLWRVPFRHLSIWKHGWPPSHCDADGDAVEPGEEGRP